MENFNRLIQNKDDENNKVKRKGMIQDIVIILCVILSVYWIYVIITKGDINKWL